MSAGTQQDQKNALLDALRRSCEANEAMLIVARKQERRLASIQFWASCTGLVSLIALVVGALSILLSIFGFIAAFGTGAAALSRASQAAPALPPPAIVAPLAPAASMDDEEFRKRLYPLIWEASQSAARDAMARFPSGSSPNADELFRRESQVLREQRQALIAEQHGITLDDLLRIRAEGIEKNWR
jgi:hypothetical protein